VTAPAFIDLGALVQRARFLLLDFDGPICSIFAGTPAEMVAHGLADLLAADGATVPLDVRAAADPFDVLRFAATLGSTLADRTEARLRDAEVAAVPTARPTPGVEVLIDAWRSSGRPVAAVSNNSGQALSTYLARHRLIVDLIIGRTSSDPFLLKPNPHLVQRAVAGLDAEADGSVLVGDSPSDMVAGQRAGVATIGYANKPGKRERLIAAGAHGVVDSFELLLP
jgi:phosphoglycolate phosphatase-like HAD superfamily hydrolase